MEFILMFFMGMLAMYFWFPMIASRKYLKEIADTFSNL